MKRSPIQLKDMTLLTKARATHLLQELNADGILIIAVKGNQTVMESINLCPHEVIDIAADAIIKSNATYCKYH